MPDSLGRQQPVERRQPDDHLRLAEKPPHQVGLGQQPAASTAADGTAADGTADTGTADFVFVFGADLEALRGRGRDHVFAEARRLAEKVRQLGEGGEQVAKPVPANIEI